MDAPQSKRKPIDLPPDEIRTTLRKRHKADRFDYFATDPDQEIRQLGRLALRRKDINDLFALGDLCARRTLTDDGRLLLTAGFSLTGPAIEQLKYYALRGTLNPMILVCKPEGETTSS